MTSLHAPPAWRHQARRSIDPDVRCTYVGMLQVGVLLGRQRLLQLGRRRSAPQPSGISHSGRQSHLL
jgi:hypothetical protein